MAVAGATGAVGQIVREILADKKLPVGRFRFLASPRSVGKNLDFAGKNYRIELLCEENIADVDLVIISTPDDVAAEVVQWARKHDTIVVDESGAHRMDDDVCLVVPEVNADALDSHQGIIASPNCSTTQMVVALNPLHVAARVKRVVVSTYQAASGTGVAGPRELAASCQASMAGEEFQPAAFAHPLGFNLIPQIGSAKHAGYTSEEMKMVWETQKIFADPAMVVCPTCVRVPVANCHSESILVETERAVSVEEARELFAAAPGICLIDDLEAGQYPMPTECSGSDDVFVGRVRKDLSHPNGLAFWCVSDNLRKGAATNAVQIAELLVQRTAGIA